MKRKIKKNLTCVNDRREESISIKVSKFKFSCVNTSSAEGGSKW